MEQQAAEVVSLFHGTFWALVPSVVAIVLALITKEAYSSLFIGVVIGGLFISQGSFPQFLDAVFKNGMVKQVSDPWNVGIRLMCHLDTQNSLEPLQILGCGNIF